MLPMFSNTGSAGTLHARTRKRLASESRAQRSGIPTEGAFSTNEGRAAGNDSMRGNLLSTPACTPGNLVCVSAVDRVPILALASLNRSARPLRLSAAEEESGMAGGAGRQAPLLHPCSHV